MILCVYCRCRWRTRRTAVSRVAVACLPPPGALLPPGPAPPAPRPGPVSLPPPRALQVFSYPDLVLLQVLNCTDLAGLRFACRFHNFFRVWISESVLRNQDVYPGSEFFPSRNRIFSIPNLHQSILTLKNGFKAFGNMILVVHPGFRTWFFTHSGSRVKRPRIRIRNTGLNVSQLPTRRLPGRYRYLIIRI